MSSQPNHSVIDGLACLQALALAGEGVGCGEMARRLNLHPVRANRLLKSLAEGGFVRQDQRRRYLPGPAFHVLAAAAASGSGLLRRAVPHLTRLAHDTGAVVALGVRWRDRVCYLWHGDAAAGSEALGAVRDHDAASSSIGRVLLAAEAGDDGNLQRIAAQGWACLTHGDAGHPHLSVAVPVGHPPIAGLACTGVPMDADLPALVDRLRAASQGIAADADVG